MDDLEILKNISDLQFVSKLLPQSISISSVLARGGQGIVYRGAINGNDAAVKIYYPGQIQLRVDREIEALTKINNPNIVSLMWSGKIVVDEYELPTMATTFIPGAPLDQLLKSRKLSPPEIGIIAYDITNAIDSMWSNLIVHRDLKPQNIMIKPDGRASVIDLGVARHINRTPLTATGATWGTSGYMSPEQSRFQKTLSCKSDIFALGIIMLECFQGKHPTGRDQTRLLSRKFYETLPQEAESWEYANLLKAMLHPEPPKRPKPPVILENLQSFKP